MSECSVFKDDGSEGFTKPFLSVVIPQYKGARYLQELYTRLKNTLESSITHQFELIFVDDASPDQVWPMIETLAREDSRVKGIQLSRNFGQYYALTAGLDQAQGDWIVIMDCDLQDVPEEIPSLYQKAQEGYDIVLAQRVDRHDTWFKKTCSKAFYMVFSFLTDTRQDSSTAQFGVYSHRTIQTLVGMRERLRFIPAFVEWMGYPTAAIPVRHAERPDASGYSLSRLLRLAMDTMLAFSDKPMRMIVKLGFGMSLVSVLFALTIVIRAILGIAEPVGWASLMTTITFSAGLIILLLGINGLYVARIFDEVKGRPLYIVHRVTPLSAVPVNPLSPTEGQKTKEQTAQEQKVLFHNQPLPL